MTAPKKMLKPKPVKRPSRDDVTGTQDAFAQSGLAPSGRHELCRDRSFIFDGKPFFQYSGEIHYFRIEAHDWEDRLQKALDAGLNTVASYIPWMFHEYEEGKFDFTGKTNPRRNVMEFIRLANRMGLRFVPRVGPISNGEMINEGLPGWLVEKYPEACLMPPGGGVIHHAFTAAYNHPVFLEKVETWYRRLLPLLTPLQYPDGPVILFQLCNEISCFNWLAKYGDTNEYSRTMFHDHLRRKYPTIARLNEAWSTKFSAFERVTFPDGIITKGNAAPQLDRADFFRTYYAVYYSRLAAIARDCGVRTLLQANIPQFYDYDVRGRGVWSPTTTSVFGAFADHTSDVVFGGAYQMRRLDYENFHDILLTTRVIETITGPDLPTVCAELQSGILSDKPRLYPPDVELNLKTTMMSGVSGVNAYMFCGGRNDPGMGQFGSYHEWQAPVATDGSLRSHFDPMRRFGRLIRRFGRDLAATRSVNDVSVAWHESVYKAEHLDGPIADQWFNHRKETWFDGVGRLCWLAGYQTGVTRLGRDLLDPKTTPFLVVALSPFMEADLQTALAEYVFAGGNLLLVGTGLIPDEQGSPCHVLYEQLKIRARSIPRVRTVQCLGHEVYLANTDISVFEEGEKPGKRLGDGNFGEVLATWQGHPCGLFKKMGRGKVVVLGFHLRDSFAYFPKILDELLGKLGAQKSVTVSGGDLTAVTRVGKDASFLFLANFHDDVVGAEICWRPGHGRPTGEEASFRLTMRPRTGVVTPRDIVLPGGGRLLYTSLELLDLRSVTGGIEVDTWSAAASGEDVIAIRGRHVRAVRVMAGEVRLERVSGTSGEETLIHLHQPAGTPDNRLTLELG
ncbi:MAG: beta-galactosidase [Candidatus Ozemobacteraceae bacterium]